jgi:hypothetical protein
MEEFKSWSPVKGVGGDITRAELERLPTELEMPEISTSVELQLANVKFHSLS